MKRHQAKKHNFCVILGGGESSTSEEPGSKKGDGSSKEKSASASFQVYIYLVCQLYNKHDIFQNYPHTKFLVS